MSYKYDPYRDTLTHIPDENSITINLSPTGPLMPWTIVKQVELTDETIDRIAEKVVEKLKLIQSP